MTALLFINISIKIFSKNKVLCIAYLRFTPEDVKELSDDAKEYEFKVFMGPDGIDGPCLGKMRVTENSADEAYSVMLDIIGCRLAEAFPELDIPYSIELVEESEDA